MNTNFDFFYIMYNNMCWVYLRDIYWRSIGDH